MTRSTFIVLAISLTAPLASCCLTVDSGLQADGGPDAGADAGPAPGDAGQADDAGCPTERECFEHCTCSPVFCGCPSDADTICFTETDAGCSIPLGCVNLVSDNNNCGACGNVCSAETRCEAPPGGLGRCISEDAGPPS